MPPGLRASAVLLFFLAAPAGAADRGLPRGSAASEAVGAADFRPMDLAEPALSPIGPLKPPQAAGLSMDDLQRFAQAAEFEEGGAPPARKAENWRALAKEAPPLAKDAEARAADWEVKSFELSLRRERAVRTARAEDWARLRSLLADAGPSDAEKSEWAARYARAYEDFPGFAVADLDEMLPLVPAGPLKDRLGRSREAALAALKAALERQTLARPELKDGLAKLGAELVFGEEGGVRVLAVVSKEGGTRLYRCRRDFSGSGRFPDIDAGAFADEVAAFLRGGAP
ncbi:MAG: hypothetical protein HYV15_01095 [Elusimicrobia bacterium]|nr:hypothetical protein [Elusimicrobiota bacterium]